MIDITNQRYPWVIAGLTIAFTIIGNWIYQPAVFDIGFKAVLIRTLLAAAGMLILPLGAIKFILKKSPREFGLAWPREAKYALKLVLILIGLNLPALFVLSQLESVRFYYLNLDNSLNYFIWSSVAGGLVYYLAEEFLFRGFLFLGLWPHLGPKSYWLTNILFAAAHWGKSYVEIIYAFFIGWWLCWLTLKTKSIWAAVLAHFALAVILNVLVNYIFV